MSSAPLPWIYRWFHTIHIILHNCNIYAGSPLEPYLLSIHVKRCVVNSTCGNCIKENRGFDLYRMISGAECTDVVMTCQRHPGYFGDGLVHGVNNNQPKSNPVVNSVSGIMQVYRQMKISLVELKNVIDQDVHRKRDSHRLYPTGEDTSTEEDEEEIENKEKKKKRHNEKESEYEDETEPMILVAEYILKRILIYRKLLLTLFQDSPGIVTAANNNTYPQFAIHIAIEGNNTYVRFILSPYHIVLQL